MSSPEVQATPVAADEVVPGTTVGAVATHPLLFAMYPALALWAANVSEVDPGDVWPAIWIPVASTLAGWLVAGVGLRTLGAERPVRKAAIGASVGVLVAMYAGRLISVALAEAIVLGIVTMLATAFAVRGLGHRAVLVTTASTNVLSLVLVAFLLPTVLVDLGGDDSVSSVDIAIPEAGSGAGLAELPDIVYIIPDRYPRADTLAEVFDYDNSPWLTKLESLGFQVADESLANYPSTGMSLTSTWNLAPIDQLISQVPENPKSWAPAYALLRDHGLGRNLVTAGYDYIHMGTWWSPTATAKSATQNLRLDGTSEFVSVFQGELGRPAIPEGEAGEDGLEDLDWFDRSPLHTKFQFHELKRLAAEQYEPRDKPRFILAHITVPHEPYVFEADGSGVAKGAAKERTREDNFVRQVEFVNNQIDEILELLLAGPREDWPMIVIQSDEGPHPAARTGSSWNWLTDASLADQREKLRTLSAILMPAASDLVVPEDLTGINTWRLLLDELLGTDLGLLPDQIYLYDPAAIYEFVDVTEKIRG